MSSSITAALLGGGLIGASASLMLYFNGRVAGISGIVGGLLARPRGAEVAWRLLFLAGLFAGGALMLAVAPQRFSLAGAPSLAVTALAGLLVGFGTRLANGCTSGHAVCGMSRLSPRSIVATATFIAAGVATVALIRLAGGMT